MKLRITKSYCWYIVESMEVVVTMYFVNGIPFTWDDLTESEETNYSCVIAANTHGKKYTPEDLFRASGYLIMEEAHPCFFEMELENPEMLAELDD